MKNFIATQYSSFNTTKTIEQIVESIKKSYKQISTKFIIYFEQLSSTFSGSRMTNSSTGFRSLNKNIKKNSIFYVVLGVFVLLVLFFVISALRNNSKNSPVLGSSDLRAVIEKPKASQTINRNFNFPLKDDSGKEIAKIKYIIQNAELRDQIIVKGARATAVQGREFLILNLKIDNGSNKALTFQAKDFVRLIVNNNDELLAPDIHNDPVEVQAISTKYTRLGFPINDSDKNLILQVGEINGKKVKLNLNLK